MNLAKLKKVPQARLSLDLGRGLRDREASGAQTDCLVRLPVGVRAGCGRRTNKLLPWAFAFQKNSPMKRALTAPYPSTERAATR